MRTSISNVAITAPQEAVWAALSVPACLARWQYGSVLATDWSVGRPLRFPTEWEGQIFEQWGTSRLEVTELS